MDPDARDSLILLGFVLASVMIIELVVIIWLLWR